MKNYYIIDGNSFMYRAYFAIPKFTTKDGFITNAIYGFTKMLLKIIKDKKPDQICVAFDHKGKSFRHDKMEQYKAHRQKMPDDLISQTPYIKEAVALLNIPMLEIEGYEADDSIASFVKLHKKEKDAHIHIITGDKDMMQLVDEQVSIYDSMKEKYYDRNGVKEKMGVYPEQIPDLLGLMGDSSDNIPGIPGIGPKTALELLGKYHTMENILENAENEKGALKEKLLNNKEIALLSKEVAIIEPDLDFSNVDFSYKQPNTEGIIEFCKKFEFVSILKDLESTYKITNIDIDNFQIEYKTITKKEAFDRIIKQIYQKGFVSINIKDNDEEEIIGISLALNNNEIYFIPTKNHLDKQELLLPYITSKLTQIFDNEGIQIYGHDLKTLLTKLDHFNEEYEINKKDQLSLF